MIDLVRNVWRPKVLWCLTTKSLWKESWDFQFPKKKKDLSRLKLDNCKSIWFCVEEKNLLKRTLCLVYLMILCTISFARSCFSIVLLSSNCILYKRKVKNLLCLTMVFLTATKRICIFFIIVFFTELNQYYFIGNWGLNCQIIPNT